MILKTTMSKARNRTKQGKNVTFLLLLYPANINPIDAVTL